MPLTITPEPFAAIRQAVKPRHAEILVTEIAGTDGSDQPQFLDVDDFLIRVDTFMEQTKADPSRSRKRQR